MRIAGNQTDADWRSLKTCLESTPDEQMWLTAYKQFYRERINTRYLHPMQFIEKASRHLGEGFSVLSLFCTLVEYLESFERGHSFRYVNNDRELQVYEYSQRQASQYFKDFLRNREPFASLIPPALVESFYRDVRCGLVHEARTKGGWIVSSKSSGGMLIAQDGSRITLYRQELLPALEVYLSNYQQRLTTDPETQSAFIRKLDQLCMP
jgi:hypothetical protein